jgi:superfamily I DNA/RNA helicase
MKTMWSDEQNAIFEEFRTGTSHFMVEARAGTGKTTTVKEGMGLAPEEKKVYLAFNRKNVNEAKLKIKDPKTQVLSLNGLGYRFVLQNWKNAKPDDSIDFDRIEEALKSDGFRRFNTKPTVVIKDIVSFAKNTCAFASYQDLVNMANARGLEPEGNAEREGWTTEMCCVIAAKVLEASKKQDPRGRISFDDQLWLPVVMKWVRPWFDLVVVDEAQDMNSTQLLMAQRACKPRGRIVLIGDPRQAIYSFRGADVRGMERLKATLKAKVFPLTTTYRCPKAVVNLAKILVPDYRAADSAPDGTVDSLDISKVSITAKPGEAIVSRKNAPLMTLCLEFIRSGKRAYIEGRDIGKTLGAIHGKINAKEIESYILALDTWAANKISKTHGNPDSDQYRDKINLIEDQAQTLKALAEVSTSTSEIGTRLSSLFEDSDNNPRPAVVLSSVHKAKGLEWDRVYLIQHTFKHSWGPDVNEEQNIAYVGITRAKSHLTWVEGKHETRKN